MFMTKLPKFALGTWLMGGTKEPDPNNDDAHDIEVIKTAIASGVSLIDTAQNYAAGRCEELVGEAVAELPRDSYQILTKQMKANLQFDEVIEGCKASLNRLGVDYIDYFVCHAPNPDTGVDEFFRAANQLYEEGLIRNVGVSNFGPKTLQSALDVSVLPIALNQVSFSLTDYDIISTGTYDFCVEHNIPIQAYRPLVGTKDNPEAMKLLNEVADKYSITAMQVAIAYINSFENMHFTLRASTQEHWIQNIDATKVQLDDDDVAKLMDFHKKQQGSFAHFLTI
jgi:2,5-diketo-D-gluconate reductase B